MGLYDKLGALSVDFVQLWPCGFAQLAVRRVQVDLYDDERKSPIADTILASITAAVDELFSSNKVSYSVQERDVS